MSVVAALAGVCTWSFLEYFIHRFAGHDRRLLKFKANFFGKEHTRHHSEGNYFASPQIKLLGAMVVVPIITCLVSLVAGIAIAAPYAVGFVGFYLYYEWLHMRLHTHSAKTRYGRWARKNHFFHHFHNPESNHGVTSSIWDQVFGTHVVVDVVRVPEKLQMDWLSDPETGDVWPEFAARGWQLRKLKKKKGKRAA